MGFVGGLPPAARFATAPAVGLAQRLGRVVGLVTGGIAPRSSLRDCSPRSPSRARHAGLRQGAFAPAARFATARSRIRFAQRREARGVRRGALPPAARFATAPPRIRFAQVVYRRELGRCRVSPVLRVDSRLRAKRARGPGGTEGPTRRPLRPEAHQTRNRSKFGPRSLTEDTKHG